MSRKSLTLVGAGPDGAVLANLGRYHRQAISTAFEMCGGVERLADWADKNYGEFVTKLYPKIIPREVEVQASEGVEDLLRQLDAPNALNITPTELPDDDGNND